MPVSLREIDADTVRAITSLSVGSEQQRFVASNAVSLAEALFSRDAWYRAIYADETPAGFVMIVNQMILDSPNGNQNLPDPLDWGLPQSAITVPPPSFPYFPKPPAGIPDPLTTRDVLRFATMNGAKALRLDGKVGSLTPGKEADIILLDATAINVAPLNQVPGAVVSLMERSNVETVIVAGKVRKWKGRLLDVNLNKLRRDLEDSRDYIFQAAGVPQNLFSLS